VWRAARIAIAAIAAIALGVVLNDLGWRIDARLARGALVNDTRDARWIVANDQLVVIFLARADGYRIIGVDPKTDRVSELQSGEGRLFSHAHDAEWLYWSVNEGRGTYVMPRSGGAIRKVSERTSRSIAVGGGHAYFSLVVERGGDDELFRGRAGEGPAQKITRPRGPNRGMADLLNATSSPVFGCAGIVVDGPQAVWSVVDVRDSPTAPWGRSEPEKARVERVRHDATAAEPFVLPCEHASELVQTPQASYRVCTQGDARSIVSFPADGSARRLLYTFAHVRHLLAHGGFLYAEASWDPEPSEFYLVKIPFAGGQAQSVVRSGSAPFAIALGRFWYAHSEGVASLSLPE
jgi:hypothetical protein